MQSLTFSRAKQGSRQFSIGLSTWYEWEDKGLIPPGIKLGIRSVGYPQHELDQIAAARIAGKSEDEIRAIVRGLVAARAQAGKPVA